MFKMSASADISLTCLSQAMLTTCDFSYWRHLITIMYSVYVCVCVCVCVRACVCV